MAASWESQLLAALNAPQSQANLDALALWAQSEGVAAGANNPLATTDHAPGSTPYPPAPAVQQYVSVAQMVSVYVGKFESTLYAAVGAALKNDAGEAAVWHAVNQSPWCAGCQGGLYPSALHAAAFTTGAQPPVGPAGLTTAPPATTGDVPGTTGPVGDTAGLEAHAPQAFHKFQLALGKHLPSRMKETRQNAQRIRATVAGRR